MSLRTRALPDRIPDPIRRWALRALFRTTVDAFEAPMPDLRRRSTDAILASYAAYTDVLARGVALDPERRSQAERRLYENTERLGRRVRRALGVRSTMDALEVAHRLYDLIGIDLTGDENEDVSSSAGARSLRGTPPTCAG